MDLQGVSRCVVDVRAHVRVRAGNLLLHVNCSHVTLHVCLVLELGAAQIASEHIRVAPFCVYTTDVVVQVALLSKRLCANLKVETNEVSSYGRKLF